MIRRQALAEGHYGQMDLTRLDGGVVKAARAHFFNLFPQFDLTHDNPSAILEVESEEQQMVLTTTLHANGRDFKVEFHGPYDLNTWNYVDVKLKEGVDEASVVGSGKTFRTALENAVRSLLRTPYEGFRPCLERESQLYLESLAGSDEIQSQDLYKIWCVLKVQK